MRKPIVLRPGDGRAYPMGRIRAVFNSGARAGVLTLSIPGGFEDHMPAIARWFAENPPGEA